MHTHVLARVDWSAGWLKDHLRRVASLYTHNCAGSETLCNPCTRSCEAVKLLE